MVIDITALFCRLDDFGKVYEEWERHKLLDSGKKRLRAGKLSLSVMMLIMVMFHASTFSNMNDFNIYGVG